MSVPSASLSAAKADSTAYDYFEYLIRDGRSQGKHAIPVAGPDPTDCKIVTFAAPVSKRTVRWVAASRAKWPDVPAVASLSGNYVFLESEIWTCSPKPTVGGGYLYIVYGEYLYAMGKARPVDSSIPVGNLPPSWDHFHGDEIMLRASFKNFLNNRQPF